MEKVGGNFNDKMREGWWEIKGNGLSYENLNFEFFIFLILKGGKKRADK